MVGLSPKGEVSTGVSVWCRHRAVICSCCSSGWAYRDGAISTGLMSPPCGTQRRAVLSHSYSQVLWHGDVCTGTLSCHCSAVRARKAVPCGSEPLSVFLNVPQRVTNGDRDPLCVRVCPASPWAVQHYHSLLSRFPLSPLGTAQPHAHSREDKPTELLPCPEPPCQLPIPPGVPQSPHSLPVRFIPSSSITPLRSQCWCIFPIPNQTWLNLLLFCCSSGWGTAFSCWRGGSAELPVLPHVSISHPCTNALTFRA